MKKQARKQPPRRKTEATREPRASAVRFPEVKGKTLEWVELSGDDDDVYIELSFQDQTALVFDICPEPGFIVDADYGDWKTHNWRRIKRWPPFRSQ